MVAWFHCFWAHGEREHDSMIQETEQSHSPSQQTGGREREKERVWEQDIALPTTTKGANAGSPPPRLHHLPRACEIMKLLTDQSIDELRALMIQSHPQPTP
jgi:hypothetical protein